MMDNLHIDTGIRNANSGDLTRPLSIAVVGGGNVAFHLCRMLENKARVFQVNSRTLQGLCPHHDLIILAVSDDAVPAVASRVAALSRSVTVHTSGSVPLTALTEAGVQRAGVLYPLQTFSKKRTPPYSEIPFFIEGTDDGVTALLRCVAHMVSTRVTDTDSDTRRRVHLASVIVCNFTNRLAALAQEYLAHTSLPYDVLAPLLHETVDKLDSLPAAEAQTGPASRGDTTTVRRHMDMLADSPEMREIYRVMSQSISNSKAQDK